MKWVVMPSSRGSSRPGDWTCVSCTSCIAGWFFTTKPLGKPPRAWPCSHQKMEKTRKIPSSDLLTNHNFTPAIISWLAFLASLLWFESIHPTPFRDLLSHSTPPCKGLLLGHLWSHNSPQGNLLYGIKEKKNCFDTYWGRITKTLFKGLLQWSLQ